MKETRLGTAFPYLYYESKSFIRQSSDSILHFVNGEFQLMFDYDVEVGDIRLVNVGGGLCSEKDTMRIDSIGTWNYQGEDLRTYHFTLLLSDQLDSLDATFDGYYIGGGLGTYVERVGLLSDHPLDLMVECIHGDAIAEYVPADFVCYTDNQLAVNHPDTCNRFLDAPEMVQESIEVFQFQNFLQVKNARNASLTVYNVQGKQLLKTSVSSDHQNINNEDFPNGILIIMIESEGHRFTQKVVKTTH